MIAGISASDQVFLAALDQAEQRASSAESEISSGYKLTQPSDDPDEIGPSLALQAQLQQTLQVQTNLGQFTSETNTAEQAISDGVQTLQQITTLGTQGATETETPAQRQALAAQVAGYLQDLVASANTQAGGRYLFSGDSDQVQPYTIDANGNVSGYQGSASTRQAMAADGTTFSIALSGQEIFEAPGGSALQAVQDLQAALQNGPAVAVGDPQYDSQYSAQTAAITNALSELSQASGQMNQQLAFYGTVQDRLSDATSTAATLQANQQAQLSAYTDADIPTEAIDLTQANTQIDAAMSAFAKLPTTTLFNYLA
ncbi:MAG: flagellin [Bryobacteraceae bacterium]|jgi:flagellar hook-associated protein 3 FlgL